MRCALTSMMRALVWPESVTIPACEPVSEIASWPRSLMTIAASAQVTRSPVESSMSISRGCGRSETSCASETSSSVCFPRAESTATTCRPSSFAATIRPAARLMRSASATEVPPNFMTTVSGMAANDSRGVASPVWGVRGRPCPAPRTSFRLCPRIRSGDAGSWRCSRSSPSRPAPAALSRAPVTTAMATARAASRCPRPAEAVPRSRCRSSRRSCRRRPSARGSRGGRRSRAAWPTWRAGSRSTARSPSCSYSASEARIAAPRSSGG